ARLLATILAAPDEITSRFASRALFEFWATAPDDNAQELLDSGMSKRAAFDFGAANLAFDALIDYCPTYAEGYNQRAFVRFLQADFVAALDDLETTIELAPNHIAALAGMALTLHQLGRSQATQQVLRRALRLNPWLPERNLLLQDDEL
ncbi:MAG: tetratricopeptide (TPR) repeat protein, partial [Candidatus Paceibacteria bacterium]